MYLVKQPGVVSKEHNLEEDFGLLSSLILQSHIEIKRKLW